MAGKHLIVMHGRDVKPSLSGMRTLGEEAIARGLERAGHPVFASTLKGRTKISFAYFGDLSNAYLVSQNKKMAKKLTDTNDAQFAFKPCFPISELRAAYALTDRRKRFSKSEYNKVLHEADDLRLLDDAANIASLFGQLLSLGVLNTLVARYVKTDVTAYFQDHGLGSAIRGRLNAILEPALKNGDDVCLITHSLGCMVAWDQMWLYAHAKEYEAFRGKQKSVVKHWITFGNPMGEPGIRRNLKDGSFPFSKDLYPRGQIKRWSNISAADDFICHIDDIRPVFRDYAKTDAIRIDPPTRIYNCWTYEEMASGRLVSNPHDMYGYLMNEGMGRNIAEWLGS